MSLDFARFAEVLAEKSGTPVTNIRPDTTLESLDVDSLLLIETVLSLEKRFEVTVDLNDVDPRDSVEQLLGRFSDLRVGETG